VDAAIGSLLGKLIRVPARHLRTFVGCWAAAGIAATFNAPIAGALFAGEVILGRFGVVRFSAIVISSVVATVISRHFIGDFPAFQVPVFSLQHTHELFFCALVGLLAAGIGCAFIWTLGRTQRGFDRLPLHPVFKPAQGGLAVGALAIGLPQVLGVGYGSINACMHGQAGWVLLLALLGAKLLATSLTLGSGGSGGIFAFSLFLGACLGGAVGALLTEWLPGQVGNPGSYALVAAGALVAATTRAPITAIIIFELTNNYTIVLPLMIACILATLLAGRMHPASIYHAKLLQKGIDLERDQETNVLRRLQVRQVPAAAPHPIGEATALNEILDQAVSSGMRHWVVADQNGDYRGMILLADLRYTHLNEQNLAPLVVAADLMHTELPTLRVDESLDLALKVFGEHEALPVLDPAAGARGPHPLCRQAPGRVGAASQVRCPGRPGPAPIRSAWRGLRTPRAGPGLRVAGRRRDAPGGPRRGHPATGRAVASRFQNAPWYCPSRINAILPASASTRSTARTVMRDWMAGR
jgi:CIC family chloride channel protein